MKCAVTFFFSVVILMLISRIEAHNSSTSDELTSQNQTLLIEKIHSSVHKALLRLNIGHSSSHSCGVRDPTTNNLRDYVIMLSISSKFFNILLNWLAFYHQLCPDRSHIYYICLDKETEDKMLAHGLPCSYQFAYSGSFSQLWQARVAIAGRFLDLGLDVLLTDIDAFWLRNPFVDIEAYQASDIIAARASFPAESTKKFGASLCFGFIYVKATDASKLIWGKLNQLMLSQRNPDDQKNLNILLMNAGLHFDNRLFYENTVHTDYGSFIINDKSFKLALLPHESYRRVCNKVASYKILNSSVVHCLTPKYGNAKEKFFKGIGLWLLKDRYESKTLFNGDFDAYLRAIIVK